MASLRIQNGPLAGQTFEVAGELVIGREGVGVVIEDARVSRHHAVVRALPGALEVEDLGSTNGTFVDGERLEGKTAVTDGAEIRVGTTVLEVRGVVAVEVTRQRPMPDPEATRLADPDSTRLADPDATRLGAARPQQVSAEPVQPAPRAGAPEPPPAQPVQPAPRAGPPEPPPAQPVQVALGGAAPALSPTPLGEFSPPPMRRGRGLASRSWVPVVLSFGSVILTAIALVVYFAAR